MCLSIFARGALAAGPAAAADSIVENYQAAARQEQRALNGASMEVDIRASLPRLKKQGRLRALRRISSLGRITYEALRFEGDSTVKNHVIVKYLAAESEAQSDGADSLAVSPANYKFKYRGAIGPAGETEYVFQVTPRKKRAGLFRGEIRIDARTFLPVLESGRLVKTPSLFLKKIEFVKEFEIQGGVSVPRRLHTVVYTRLAGPAELTVDFRNVSLAESPKQASLVDVEGQ